MSPTKDYTIAHQVAHARIATTTSKRRSRKAVLSHNSDHEGSGLSAAREVEINAYVNAASGELPSEVQTDARKTHRNRTSHQTSTSPAKVKRKSGRKPSCESTESLDKFMGPGGRLTEIPREGGFLLTDVARYCRKDISQVTAIARRIGIFRYAKYHNNKSGPITHGEARFLIQVLRAGISLFKTV
jgi:hypothetical protein